jgi:Zn-dependent protease/CBS domain-containing protein
MIGVPIARILGIEIRVQLGWIFVLALIGVIAVEQLAILEPTLADPLVWFLGGLVAAGFFVSSVAHDLAHALVARRRGLDVKAIAVSFFGGATPLDPTAPDARDDLAIALSGPLTSLGIAALLFIATVAVAGPGGSFGAAAGVLAVLVFLNLVLGLVNLVPAYPLDGGRIIRAIAWARTGSERSGWHASSLSGRLTGVVTILVGGLVFAVDRSATGLMIALTGWFLILTSNAVRERIRLDELVGGFIVSDAMEPDPITVHPSLTIDTFASQLLAGDSPMTAVPVVEGGGVVGLLGAGQVRRIRRDRWAGTRVEDVMAKPPKLTFVTPLEPLRAGLEQLQRAGLDGLPVLEEGRLVGVLTRRSIGRFVQATKGGPAGGDGAAGGDRAAGSDGAAGGDRAAGGDGAEGSPSAGNDVAEGDTPSGGSGVA